MASTRTFNNMLNEYLAIDLLVDEWLQRDYLFNKVNKDDGWKGGTLPVPFRGQHASSVKFGGLTAANDLSEFKYVRGQVSDYHEVWGSLIFNQRDLYEHDGKVNEKSFLRILPDQIDDFMNYLKMVVSVNLLKGPAFAVVNVDGTAGGVLGVDRPDLFTLDQKFDLIDNNTAAVSVYVIAIDMNSSVGYPTGKITVSLTRGGAAADVSAYSVAQVALCYHDGILVAGVPTNNFSSLKLALLSSANGGSSTLYGQSKIAYPYLQAINVSGATVTASNLLDKLFDAYTEIRTKARGNADTILMSFKNLGTVMKLIETQKGAFKTNATMTKASEYGWTEIEIVSVKGKLTIVGIQEMPDDVIFYLDWAAMTFFSNGMFKKRKNPSSGQEFFEVRNTTGFQYIVDVSLFGELVVHAPANCGIMYGISY